MLPGHADAKDRAQCARTGPFIAASKGFETTGTLGILDLAAKRNLIDLKDVIERLKQTNFRYSRDIIDKLLAQFNSG